MKLRHLGIYTLGLFSVLLAAVAAFMAACGNNNSPAAPVSPAPTATFTITNTPCMNSSLTPCTNSPTPTLTFTLTLTFTFTPTFTDTPCRNSSQTPCTNSPTATATPTSTATSTSTWTYTPCVGVCMPSLTPTPTSAPSGNPLSFSITYTGGGTVNATHPLVGLVNCTSCNYFTFKNDPANGKPITFTGTPAGTYYTVLIYAAAGMPYPPGPSCPFGAYVGDYYAYYNGPGLVSCSAFTPMTVSGTTNMGTISFGNSCQLIGVFGNVTYTGSGIVQYCNPIYVVAYSDPAYTSSLGASKVTANGTRYDYSTLGSSQTVYLRAFYDVNDSNNGSCPCVAGSGGAAPGGSPCPHAGDPYVNMGSYFTSSGTIGNISFGSSKW